MISRNTGFSSTCIDTSGSTVHVDLQCQCCSVLEIIFVNFLSESNFGEANKYKPYFVKLVYSSLYREPSFTTMSRRLVEVTGSTFREKKVVTHTPILMH